MTVKAIPVSSKAGRPAAGVELAMTGKPDDPLFTRLPCIVLADGDLRTLRRRPWATSLPAGTKTSTPRRKKQRRLACEARMIAEARAQLEADFYVDATDVDAWIDSLDTDNELPPPLTRRR
jgi:hypothetical protein